MAKKTFWYVSLGLLWCTTLVLVVNADSPNGVRSLQEMRATGPTLLDPASAKAVANEALEPAGLEAEIVLLERQLHDLSPLDNGAPMDIKLRLNELYAQREVNRPGQNPLDQGNDACPATSIPSLPYTDSGTTVGYVNNYTDCGPNTAPDVIYQFTATTTTTVRVSLCGSAYDTRMEVRSGGACPGTTQLACNDDFCGLQSQVDVGMTAGTTYFIIVDGWSSSEGAYTLNLSDIGNVRPCPTMTPVDGTLNPVPSTPWAGTITGNCGNGGKWVGTITTTQYAEYFFDLCPNEPGDGQSNFDADIKIVDAAGTILAGVDGLSTCTPVAWNPNAWAWTAPASATYYVVIAPYSSYSSHTCNGTAGNTFTLKYHVGPPCSPVVPYDNCSAVTPSSLPINTTGNNHCATNDGPCLDPSFQETWHAFTLTQTCAVTVRVCGQAGNWQNFYWVAAQGCPCNTWILRDDYTFPDPSCANGGIVFSFNALAPGTYYIPVLRDDDLGARGAYSIQITSPCAGCAPPQDLTIVRAAYPSNNVILRWQAESNGSYKVWRTENKNNDGDPNNGTDPDWTLVTTLPAPGTPGLMTYSTLPTASYYNYVVVHECTP